MGLQPDRFSFFAVILISTSKSLAFLATSPLAQSHFDEIGASCFSSGMLMPGAKTPSFH